jgi:hypothetical protein
MQLDPKVRVLLVTPSNMAADVLATKIMDQFDENFLNYKNVLRLRSIRCDFYSRDKSLDPISLL